MYNKISKFFKKVMHVTFFPMIHWYLFCSREMGSDGQNLFLQSEAF